MSIQMSGSPNRPCRRMAERFTLFLTGDLVWVEETCGFQPWMRQAPGRAPSMRGNKLILHSMKFHRLFMRMTKHYILLPTVSLVLVDTIFFLRNGIPLYGRHRKTLAI